MGAFYNRYGFFSVSRSFIAVIDSLFSLVLSSASLCCFLFLFLFTLIGSFIMVTDYLIIYSQSFCYQRYSFFTPIGSFIAVTDSLVTPVLLSPLLIL